MGRCKGLSTNHVGLVVEDPDRFITIMTGLFDYTLLDRGTRDRVVQAQAYGLTEVGQMVVVNAGPHKGNKIISLATAEGVIIELIQKGI